MSQEPLSVARELRSKKSSMKMEDFRKNQFNAASF